MDHINKVVGIWKGAFLQEKPDKNLFPHQEELNRIAKLFSPGLQYHYVVNMSNYHLEYISEGVEEILGLKQKEATIEKLMEHLVPSYKNTLAKKEAVVIDFFCNFLPASERLSYKCVYFLIKRNMEGNYKKILHQASALNLSESNQPKHVLVVHTDISDLNLHQKDSLNFINIEGEKSYFDVPYEDGKFDVESCVKEKTDPLKSLSEREKEIIKRIAEGMSTFEIAEKLCISVHTLRTHRRNIIKKSSFKNIQEVVTQCLIAGII